ncbi:hypothetical protein [Methylobacterium sp. 17Sr1-1]|uniref:hypothetical protein n=1 Tax=Methylobacterium sp. 17Sr1-1 TaxID=2202826 RepID=UPI000D6ECC82|nr:hypothetical protein [Methylobacterium sp. 17Sr1-1]AWN52670.1 hypothetical protein DK412_14355 [Methylobacterium sp. 17Sr1-1]
MERVADRRAVRVPGAEAGAPSLAGFEAPQKPLGEIGAREAYAACLGRDTLAGYEEFVAAYRATRSADACGRSSRPGARP